MYAFMSNESVSMLFVAIIKCLFANMIIVFVWLSVSLSQFFLSRCFSLFFFVASSLFVCILYIFLDYFQPFLLLFAHITPVHRHLHNLLKWVSIIVLSFVHWFVHSFVCNHNLKVCSRLCDDCVSDASRREAQHHAIRSGFITSKPR